MNPFNEYRKSYITACLVLAVIYAFILEESLFVSSGISYGLFAADIANSLPTNANIRLLFCLTDGLIYGGMLYLTGIILWNIFRFAIPTNYNSKYQLIFISALVILAGLFITAAESLAIYLCFPSIFDSFAHSIPTRLFITILIVITIRLLYLFYHEKNKNISETPEEEAFYENTILDNATPDNTISGVALLNTSSKLSGTAKSPIDRITVRNGQKIIIIPIDEIIFIKADGDYISINTDKGTWLKEQTMKYTEKTLPVDSFVRIHRSYIININYISRIERYGEKQQIVLHNNEKIKVSAARYQVLKQVLGL